MSIFVEKTIKERNTFQKNEGKVQGRISIGKTKLQKECEDQLKRELNKASKSQKKNPVTGDPKEKGPIKY